MNATDVVGYAFNADLLCGECTRGVAIASAQELGDATVWGDCGSAEDALGAWANAAGIDQSEADSNEFPCPAFADQACVADHCGQCGYNLLGEF